MANQGVVVVGGERAGAEIVYGAEECYKKSLELLEELGFPKGVMPLKNLVECGRVRATGYVWMKQNTPYEHFFEATNTRVSYGLEVTAYVDKCCMKKMTGVKSKQMFLWVPIVEMSMEEPKSKKIYFKTPMGIGKSFHVTAFMDEEEKRNFYLENPNKGWRFREIPRLYQAKLDEMREEMIIELTAFVSQQVSQQSNAGTSGVGAGIWGPNTNAP